MATKSKRGFQFFDQDGRKCEVLAKSFEYLLLKVSFGCGTTYLVRKPSQLIKTKKQIEGIPVYKIKNR